MCQTDNDVMLSIVMPVFNGTDTLKIMINSIISNSFTDWELLAVDDGSEKDTLDVLNDYANNDVRIKVFVREELPKGAPTCRNIGYRHAKGKYIIFFDSDDMISSSCLQTRVMAMEEHKDKDFMVFPSAIMENEIIQDCPSHLWFGFDLQNNDVAQFLRRNLPFVVCNNIYRTKSLRNASLAWNVNLRSLQDADFNLQTILAGLKYAYCKTSPDYFYRINYNVNSISSSIKSAQHCESHVYAAKHFADLIRAKYRNKYNFSLYIGILNIYNSVRSMDEDLAFAKQLNSVVDQFSKWFSFMMLLHILFMKFFRLFLPNQKARQISMAFYLIYREMWRKGKVRAINKLINRE